MPKYKVGFFIDNTYEVYDAETRETYYQGSLADCEAWIRLHESGYMS